jgi:hypothetical protein
VRRAYRKAALVAHPDKLASATEAEKEEARQKFLRVSNGERTHFHPFPPSPSCVGALTRLDSVWPVGTRCSARCAERP